YFDLDAVRTPGPAMDRPTGRGTNGSVKAAKDPQSTTWKHGKPLVNHPAGAPPLDWWEIPPGGYQGAHYAVYPEALCVRPIEAMCPRRVCTTCGEPSRRITEATPEYAEKLGGSIAGRVGKSKASGYLGSTQPEGDHIVA